MAAWLQSLSINAASGPSPPSQRPYSPSPISRKASHLVPSTYPSRPSLSTRSSSLSLVSNASLPATARFPSGSGLRNEINNIPPPNVQDPLEALEDILGIHLIDDEPSNLENEIETFAEKPSDLVEDIEFGSLSLEEYMELPLVPALQSSSAATRSQKSIEECEKDRTKFEDLHKLIASCDGILQSVEKYLSSFQADLGAVSAEIETLQNRSTSLNAKLENRKNVEKLLGPTIEQVTLSPLVVQEISDRPLGEAWVSALEQLQNHAKALETGKLPKDVRALEDLKPLVNELSDKAVERIRDYFATQIKALRAPSINAQVIQRQAFLPLRPIYGFLTKRQPQLGAEIAQAYTNTMRWYYSSHFSRYHASLSKLKLYTTDKQSLLGEDPAHAARNRNAAISVSHDPYNLGRRIEPLRNPTNTALPSQTAEDTKTPQHIEAPFLAFNLALVDNASFEYTFATNFFVPPASIPAINRHFQTMFAPTFALGSTLLKTLVAETHDALGVLLLIRLTQHFAFILQRRKVPTLDAYINGTSMVLWPRFQQLLDAHCDSLKRLTASLPNRAAGSSGAAAAASALIGGGGGAPSGSTAPHPVTQRFALFVHGILSLSSEAGDDEPVSKSLGRLRAEYEAFLTKLGAAFGSGEKGKRDRGRLLANNYSLVLAVLGDVKGRMGEEMKEHFQGLMEVAGPR